MMEWDSAFVDPNAHPLLRTYASQVVLVYNHSTPGADGATYVYYCPWGHSQAPAEIRAAPLQWDALWHQ